MVLYIVKKNPAPRLYIFFMPNSTKGKYLSMVFLEL